MPGIDGIDGIASRRSAPRSSHVVVLTSFSDRERILAALDAGAVGNLLKDAEPDEVVRGVQPPRGESPLAPKAADRAQRPLGARAGYAARPQAPRAGGARTHRPRAAEQAHRA
jgi:DNA-binding NarL/FixJ family response regulator